MALENVATPPAQKKPTAFKPKEADKIIYRLLQENPKDRQDTPRFPPYKRFPNTDIISWTFKNADGTTYEGERAIRYLPGHGSIFVDEQEAGGREIPENVINNPNNRFEIIDGDINVRPHEKTKIQFLDYCNRNADSPHRTNKTAAIFSRYSDEKFTKKLAETQLLQQEAIKLAYNATDEKIFKSMDRLGIAAIDFNDQSGRSLEAITADYRQAAMDNPKLFLEVYNED